MARYKRRLFNWLVPAMLLCLSLGSEAQARSIALLIGVGAYPNLGARSQLLAPRHDVEAMRNTLQQRWGFAAQDIQTLIDSQATKAGILAALRQLRQRSQPGDNVLVFFSGHGTSRLDNRNQLGLDPFTGALIPADYGIKPNNLVSQLIVGRTELQPILKELDLKVGETGSLWYVTDSCFSGNQVRSIRAPSGATLTRRYLPLYNETSDEYKLAHQVLPKEYQAGVSPPWPYQKLVALTASSEGELAAEIGPKALESYPTIDGKPHGALTDALLRVLQGQWPADINRDGVLSLAEAHNAVTRFMRTRGYGQTPRRLPSVAQDQLGASQTPVLAARGIITHPRAADTPTLLRVAIDAGVSPRLRDIAVRQLDITQMVQVGEAQLPDVTFMAAQDNAQALELYGASRDRIAGPFPEEDVAKLRHQLLQRAWANRLRQLAERHRRDLLNFEIQPNEPGGNLQLGEDLAFVVTPKHPATVVVLDVMADGTFTILYPSENTRDVPLPAGKRTCLPARLHPNKHDQCEGEKFKVTTPLGLEDVFAFAFDETPADFERWKGAPQHLILGDQILLSLERSLEQASGRFDFVRVDLRTRLNHNAGSIPKVR